MDLTLLGFALAAGLVAALNPCGFAMLPAYLSLVVLGDDADSDARGTGAVGRALAATALMALGFLLVFGVFGLVVAPLASALQRYLPAVTVVIGVAMVVLGGLLVSGRELRLPLPRSGRGAPTARLGSMVGYGVAYAIASLSCTIGPFLAVSTATFGTGSALGGIVAYLAYGLGMAVMVGVLAVVVALAGAGAVARARRLLPHVQRVSGVLLVLAGLYVGWYGVFELRQNFGDGTATDPVVDAVTAVQQVVSGWVDFLGAPLFALALLVLVLGAALWRRRRRGAREVAASSSGRPEGHRLRW